MMGPMSRPRVVILGAGLAGLSASLHLPEDFEVEVHEREDEPGGVARSRRVGGFTFDYTGHLLHLRDPAIKALVDRLCPDAFRTCDRHAYIWSHGAHVPYPFQANLHGLPPDVVAECLVGFVNALMSPDKPEDAPHFEEWSRRCFGDGISRHFMIPYNEKLYCRELSRMSTEWVAWSVPRPSLEQVVRGAVGTRIEGLGYNPTFFYPKEGGIDVLARGLAGAARGIRLRSTVAGVDLVRRVVRFTDGRESAYDHLVSTLPLRTLYLLADPVPEDLREAARALTSVTVCGFNFGIAREGVSEHDWVYVPEPEYPFYRIGFPSSFSRGVTPPGASSAYVEVAVDRGTPIDMDATEARVLEGMRRMGVLRDDDVLLARDRVVIDPAYVVFDPHRAAWRDRLLDFLLDQDVQSIGRYGAWTYSGMEDALLAGRQAARVITGEEKRGTSRAGDR
jgi:protoporphyrinogen oxidase